MEILLDKIRVNVIINRKRNKNIYFRFDKELNLVVNTSLNTSEKEIRNLILKNEDALIKLREKCYKKEVFNQEFRYLGNKYNIVFDNSYKEIDFQNGTIYVASEQMLKRFLTKKTKEIFLEEVVDMQKIIKTPPFRVIFRKMKTRWGVCNYKLNTITLNTELIKYRRDLLRYVIVHEMCHFYHHNHQKEFWQMVSLYYPDYKSARKELRS